MKLRIPSAYQSVTIGQFIDWHDALDDIERVMAVTGLTRELIEQLSPASIKAVCDTFRQVLESEAGVLTREIKVGGVKHGFLPSMDELTFREFADLTKLAEVCMGEKPRYDMIPLIMAVLYRPIKMKIGKRYRIAPYDSDDAQERAHSFRAISMEVYAGAMLFFSRISNELKASGLRSLETQRTQMMRTLKKTMQELDNELLRQD